MDTVKLYLRSMKMLLRSQLQYPLSFIMQTLSQIVMTGGELMAVLLLIDRFDSLNHWAAGDLLFIYGMMDITFYLTECFGRGVTGNFAALVRSGGLDTLFLRPRGIFTQTLCRDVDPRRIGCISVGVVTLIMGAKMAGIEWTMLKWIAFTESILLGVLLILGLFMIEVIFSIYSVKSIEVVNALTYGGRSACQYPIDVYPRALRLLFMVVAPFALTLHVPAAYILGKPLYGWPEFTAFLCPLAGVVLFSIMYFCFQKALRHYRSTGS